MKDSNSSIMEKYPYTTQFVISIVAILLFIEFFAWLITIIASVLIILLPLGVVFFFGKDFNDNQNDD